MRDVYEQNPKLGDAATLTKQLDESSHAVDRLRADVSKYEVCIRRKLDNPSPNYWCSLPSIFLLFIVVCMGNVQGQCVDHILMW